MKTKKEKDELEMLSGQYSKVTYYNSKPALPGFMAMENLPMIADDLDGSVRETRRNDIEYLQRSYEKLMSGEVTIGVEAMNYGLDRKRFKALLIKKGFDADAIYKNKKKVNKEKKRQYAREYYKRHLKSERSDL